MTFQAALVTIAALLLIAIVTPIGAAILGGGILSLVALKRSFEKDTRK